MVIVVHRIHRTLALLLPLLLVVAARAEDYSAPLPPLADYSIQFQKCSEIQSYSDELAEEGWKPVLGTQRFATFRLCPNDPISGESCSHCESHHGGEYIVDLGTYLQATAAHYQTQQHDLCKACDDVCKGEATTRPDPGTEDAVTVSGELVVEQRQFSNGNNGLVDCDTCADECMKIQNMEENGYIDATAFLECQMIYDPEDDGLSALFAGPLCASGGTKIKIGVFTDEDCQFEDPSKAVDDYLIDGDGYQMKLSHALLKQTYSERACLSCQGLEENVDDAVDFGDVAEVCYDLYSYAAKCETASGVNGLRSSPLYHNQLAQVDSVCRFIETVNRGTYKDTMFHPMLLPIPPEPPTPGQEQVPVPPLPEQPSPIATAQSRKGHGRRLEEPWYYDSTGNAPEWMKDYSLRFAGCQQFPRWNREAYLDESVRLATKRLAHYQLCPKEDNNGCSSNVGACNNYTMDLNEFLPHYFSAMNWDCDYLEQKVCNVCQEDFDCRINCYNVHGMAEACGLNDGWLEDDTKPVPLVPPGFLECQQVSRSVYDSDGQQRMVYIGPYCTSGHSSPQQVRLAFFSDDTCTIFLSELERREYLRDALIYRNHSLIQQEGEGTCLSCDATAMEENNMLSEGPRSGLCQALYLSSGKCEGSQRDTYSSTNACDYIQSFQKAATATGNQNMYYGTPHSEQVFFGYEGEAVNDTVIDSSDLAEDSLTSSAIAGLSSSVTGLLALGLLLAY